MMISLGSLVLCLSLSGWVSAFDVRGNVQFGNLNTSVPLGSKVSLGHGAKTTLIRHDGSFVLTDVPDGEFVLETQVPGYTFQSVFLTVNAPEIHVQVYHPARFPAPTTIPSLSHPLILSPTAADDYYTVSQGLNIVGLLKNPMVLMMLFTGGMLFAMPKIMSSLGDMDPEMAQEVAETRKKMEGMQNMDFMGSLSNILAGGTEDKAAGPVNPNTIASAGTSTPPTPQRGGGGNGGGGKKRRGR